MNTLCQIANQFIGIYSKNISRLEKNISSILLENEILNCDKCDVFTKGVKFIEHDQHLEYRKLMKGIEDNYKQTQKIIIDKLKGE